MDGYSRNLKQVTKIFIIVYGDATVIMSERK